MRGKYARRRAGRPAYLARLAAEVVAEVERHERAQPRTPLELWHEARRLGLASERPTRSPVLTAIRNRHLATFADLDLLVDGTPLEWLCEFNRGRGVRPLGPTEVFALFASSAGVSAAEVTEAFQAMSRAFASPSLSRTPAFSTNRRHR